MIAWIFGLFWNVISVPLTLQIAPEALERGNDAALFALIFPVVGVALLAWAIVETLRYRRYGLSVFRMARVPAPVGRLLKGVIVTHAYIRPAEGLQGVGPAQRGFDQQPRSLLFVEHNPLC